MFNIARVSFVHVLYMVYYGMLWWRLGLTLDPFSSFHKTTTVAMGVVLSLAFIVVQIIMILCALVKKSRFMIKQTWCHFPMLMFILLTIAPYGIYLHHQYMAINPFFSSKSVMNKTVVVHHEISCFDLQLPKFDFFVIQIALPVLVVTYLLYPFPDRNYKHGEVFAVAIEFLNAFDIMDLVLDIGCVQKYSAGWIVLFYIALGVSTVLLAFPVRLEEDDKDDPHALRILGSILTLVFTDIFFCTIRIAVMYHEKNLQTGFHFFMKNLLAAIVRPFLIVKGCKE